MDRIRLHLARRAVAALWERRNELCLAILISGLLFCAEAAFAQVATGTPPFGSFSGGPDVVNNANLNVHISIPVVAKTGRGLPFTYTLSYDSSVWYPVTSGSNQVWTPVSNWGWRGITEVETGYITYSGGQASCFENGTTHYFMVYGNWVYHDSFGSRHPYSFVVSNASTNGCSHGPPYSASETSLDGSGYTISASATPSATVKSRSALSVLAPLQSPSGNGSATDRNGNKITATVTSNTNFTDTLGTTALTVSGNGTESSPRTLTYTGPQGSVSARMNYTTTSVKTSFGCGDNYVEYGPTNVDLVTSITLPDSTSYGITYEPTPGDATKVTGRIKSITFPTGGTITYTYTGGSSGHITCADGSASGFDRAVSPGGTWTYAHTESGTAWTTTLTKPNSEVTVFNFQQVSAKPDAYETERQIKDSAGNVLETVDTCYNGAAIPCTSTSVTQPINNRTVQTTLGTLVAKTYTTYDTYGLPRELDEYTWGSVLVRKTLIAYASLGNGIKDRPSVITIQEADNTKRAEITFLYDETTPTATTGTPQWVSVTGSRGNATTIKYWVVGTTTRNRTFTYFDTGNVKSMTDVNAQITNYAYDSTGCANSLLTTVTPPITSLARSMAWDCTGGVVTSTTDENSKQTTFTYDDPNYWRVKAIADQFPSTMNISYFTNPFGSESDMDFNGTISTVDSRATLDGLGRGHITQRKQSQGSSTYDSVQADYDSVGRLWRVSVPYGAAAGAAYTGASFTTTTYDALGRPLLVTDAGGGTVSYSYTKNDVLVTVGPDPDGAGSENTKRRQFEYDALGRLTSVCEVTSATGNGSCAQSSTQTGYWTKYTYDAADRLLTVTQNAQSTPTQTRTYTYDGLGRVLTATDPESGQTIYTYDSDSSAHCSGTYNGDLVMRKDAVLNYTCYTYDSTHRLLDVTLHSSSPYLAATPEKHLVYDSATVNGVAMANAKGRLAEAYTGPSASKITDLGFSYGPTGLLENAYQKTPNSAGYYRAKAAYWPNGLINALNLYKNDGSTALLPTFTYAPEGEGRVDTVSASTGQNPVTDTAYGDLWGQPTGVTFGSGDTDAFIHDSNTGRMTQYKFNIGSPVQSVIGNLTWNANASLKTLGITDPFNSPNTQTCNYTYDDMARIKSANCGTIWNETFAFDVFGNIGKTGISGATDFCPNSSPPACYNTATNRITTVGSQTFAYDSNGNLTSTGTGTGTSAYTWDAEGHMKTDSPSGLTSVTLTYDALGRMVEQARGTSYTQIVYGPLGNKLALMTGQTLTKAFVPLSGGATAVYGSGGTLTYYRHSDWQGSSRFASTPTTRTKYFSGAYAPYGENYAESGTTDRNFTGQNQDTTADLYDFMFREHNYTHGRWLSPDPLAGDISNPQSLNRYAYVVNNPTNFTDPLGLIWGPPVEPPDCDPFWGCPPPCDPFSDFGCEPPPGPPGGGGGGGGDGGGGGGGGSPPGNAQQGGTITYPGTVPPPTYPEIIAAIVACLSHPYCRVGAVIVGVVVLGYTGYQIYQSRRLSPNQEEIRQARRIAREFCVNYDDLSDAIHDYKKRYGNFPLSQEELENLARGLPKIPGCTPAKW